MNFSMRYRIRLPHPVLSKYVKYFWCLDVQDSYVENYRINTLVDDSSGLIFHHHEGQGAILTDDKIQPVSMIYGQTTKPSLNRAISKFEAVGVLFYPHAIHNIFGEFGSSFTDKVIPFDNFENVELTNKILDINDFDDQINIITEYLLKRITTVRQPANLVENCLSLINSKNGLLTVADIYSYFKISERTLERQFNKVIGVTPRHFLKVIRFKYALELLRRMPNEKFTAIAYMAGYSDQAHFNRVVKEFTKYTPTKLKEVRDLPVNLMSF